MVYNFMRGDWILDRDVYDSADNLDVSNGDVSCGRRRKSAIPNGAPTPTNLLVYQPADRFWLFQYLETGLYVTLAALLIVLAIWQIRRRITATAKRPIWRPRHPDARECRTPAQE